MKIVNMKRRTFKNKNLAKNYLTRFSKTAIRLKKEIDCIISYDCKIR